MHVKRVLSAVSAIAMLMSVSALTGCQSIASADNLSENTSVSDNETGEKTVTSDYDKLRVGIDGTKFVVDGKELWINGVNTPWQNWNDFGGNFDPDFWDNHFAELHEAGVNATRIWVNCNGMSIVRLRTDGTVQAIDEQHWTDLDTLF